MSSSLARGWRTDVRGLPPSQRFYDVDRALQLARQLCECLPMPMGGEQAHGVRMRLVRAQALSILDLLTDIVTDARAGA